jgi:hypothetical protein
VVLSKSEIEQLELDIEEANALFLAILDEDEDL